MRSFGALARRLERPAGWLLGRPSLRACLRRRAVRAWRAGVPVRAPGGSIVADRFSPAATVACAVRYGVDLSGHRSRRVRRDELRSANAIFVFDLDNVARVAALDPLALARTHLLGALDEDPDVVIANPHGRGDAVLALTLARIARAVEHGQSSPYVR